VLGQAPLVQLRLTRAFYQRVAEAARSVEQPVTAWIRMAILEKLERDGR